MLITASILKNTMVYMFSESLNFKEVGRTLDLIVPHQLKFY